MSISLPLAGTTLGCWQQIGVWGNRSCPELPQAIHCHNCAVFAAAGRRFLDAPTPPGYLDEWTERLGLPDEGGRGKELSVLVFRIAEEWLALPVSFLVEVTPIRPVHRIPHRGGLLAGMVNIRGELHLCVRLDLLLGISQSEPSARAENSRFLVIRDESSAWVFAVDEIDQVRSIPIEKLVPAAPTLSRAASHFNKGVFSSSECAVGLLDDERIVHALRERTR